MDQQRDDSTDRDSSNDYTDYTERQERGDRSVTPIPAPPLRARNLQPANL